MNEEHTSIAPSAEQAENERDARAEELQSTFSYDGYGQRITDFCITGRWDRLQYRRVRQRMPGRIG